METSDSEILKSFNNPATREAGFKMLIVKYQQRLYWQIRRIVLIHDDADDILQNVFIKVWKNLGKFQQQSQLYTWLYRIAANESLTFLSQKKKKATDWLNDENQDMVGNLTADQYFDGDDIQKKLQLAINTLPDKQKQVFLMRYYDELSYEEMSEILGTSVGALKASYHFAAKKNRIILNRGLNLRTVLKSKQRMNKHEEIRKELREIAPNLEKLEKGNPFRTPDYYFQSLPDKIAEKVKGSATPPMWTDRAEKWLNNFFSMIFQPRVAIPVAALMLGLVVGISLFRANNNVAFDVSQPLSEISTEEIDEYVIENFDDADLMALGESTGQLNGFIPSDIPKDELEDFLQNNTDNQTLEEEIL